MYPTTELNSIYSEAVLSMMTRPTEILDPSTLIRSPTSLRDLATRAEVRDSLGVMATGEDVLLSLPAIDDGATHEPSETSTARATDAADQIWQKAEWYFDPEVTLQRGKLEREIIQVFQPLFEAELPQERRLRSALGVEGWPELPCSIRGIPYQTYEPRAEWRSEGVENCGVEFRAAEAKIFEAAVGRLVRLVVQKASAHLTQGEVDIAPEENDAIPPAVSQAATGLEAKAGILTAITQKVRVFHDELQKDWTLRIKWTDKVAGVWERMIRTYAAYPYAANGRHQPGSIWEEQAISYVDV
ncbi:hypothetical protein QFC20_004574 [Naganishia adeliensis]|uniref:Uncharacterized protein n=1 Tax=Naganishia adeliensis TaxID=92952 RepID=A0ACC2VZL4_9TREE|nr:hypothetical protein QFC20_004574 [Naganishia adeliensis]